jgi:hypothetical protein
VGREAALVIDGASGDDETHQPATLLRCGVQGRRAVGVASQTPLIFVKPMWQVAQ